MISYEWLAASPGWLPVPPLSEGPKADNLDSVCLAIMFLLGLFCSKVTAEVFLFRFISRVATELSLFNCVKFYTEEEPSI